MCLPEVCALGICLVCCVSGSLLLAFQDEAPAWVTVLGSLMVVLSMVPAYQVRRSAPILRLKDGCCWLPLLSNPG